MEITHDRQADMMYIKFSNKSFHKNQIVIENKLILDLSEDGSIIGIEIFAPSLQMDDPDNVIYTPLSDYGNRSQRQGNEDAS